MLGWMQVLRLIRPWKSRLHDCVGTSAHGLLIAFLKEVFKIDNSVSGALWVEALNVHTYRNLGLAFFFEGCSW